MNPFLYYGPLVVVALVLIVCASGLLTRSSGGTFMEGVVMMSAILAGTAALVGSLWLVLVIGSHLTGVPA